MKKLFLLIFALTLALSSFSCVDNKVVESTRASLVRITADTFGGQYVCTGFVIQPNIILTAAHCLQPNLSGDGEHVSIRGKDDFYDLALLLLKTTKPALSFRDTPVMESEGLIGIGYGDGWTIPIAIKEIVLVPNYAPFRGASSGIIGKAGFVGGMSGGPVIDASGSVVGIIQRGLDGLDYGVGVTMIKAFLLDNGITLVTTSPNGGIDWQN